MVYINFLFLFQIVHTELGIRLDDEIQVLGMLKSNPRVDQQQPNSGNSGGDRTLAFQYRARYSLRLVDFNLLPIDVSSHHV